MNNKAEPEYKNLLSGKSILLSASFPSKDRDRKFYDTSDVDEIYQAIVSFVRAIFAAGGRVLFGGHPTISPLVLMVAEEYIPSNAQLRNELKEKKQLPVSIYQSKAFGEFIPEATLSLCKWGLGEIIWTESTEKPVFVSTNVLDPNSVRESLLIMRNDMLKKNPVAAIFIGGMEGVLEESALFKKNYPEKTMYFIGAPGGAAKILASEIDNTYSTESMLSKKELLESRNYPSLMQRIVIDISTKMSY